MRISFLKQIVIGFLLSLIFMQGAPTAHAQFVVYDQAAFTQHLQEYIKEAERWVETVNHYTTMVENAVKQVTTLGGILTLIDRTVARDDSIFASFANLGRSIRGVFTLKRQIEALVVRNIRSLKNIDDRLKAGIFNPQADLADLEDYLKSSIGRASQDRAATLERIANMDTLLQRWYEELQMAQARKAAVMKQKEIAEQNLEAEEAKPTGEGCATCITDLKREIEWCEDQILKLDQQISELTTKIEERMKKWNVEMLARGDAARDVQEMERAWDRFFSVREDTLNEIDNYTGSRRNDRRPIQ